MTAWRLKSQDHGNFFSNFCVFWKKDPYGKIFKILFWKFSPPHRSTLLYSNVVKLVRLEIDEIVRYLPKNKISAPSETVATARNLPGIAPNIWLTMFQILSKSVHFRRSYSRTREGRSFGPYAYDICNIRLCANNEPFPYTLARKLCFFLNCTAY